MFKLKLCGFIILKSRIKTQALERKVDGYGLSYLHRDIILSLFLFLSVPRLCLICKIMLKSQRIC